MKILIFLKKNHDWLDKPADEVRRRLHKIQSLTNLLSPLSQITSQEALEDLLRARATRFRRLEAELEELLWPTLEEIKDQSGKLYGDMREATLTKADLLGQEVLEQLLGAIDSSEAFNNWMIESSEQGPRAIYRFVALNQEVGEPALYADMCISTLMGILTDHFTDWVPEAMSVLAKAADDYMAEVEDVFLAELPATEEAEQAVDFEALRKELGL